MATIKYLLYPAADDQACLFYQRQTEKMQGSIIASSSLAPNKKIHLQIYRHYKQLPNVFDDSFVEMATQLINNENITTIFCSNEFVADELSRIFPNCSVIMIGDGQISLTNRYIGFEQDANLFIDTFTQQYNRKPLITSMQLTEILYSVSALFGESHTSKLLHFVDILEHSPPFGTVIEAGALMGKQSVALALLGSIYQYKELLIVDPWGMQTEHQNEGCPKLYTFYKGRYKLDYIKKICEANIHNQKYQNVRIIQNTIEQEISNIDEISFIYLDGNHDYSAVSTQLKLLKDKMLPGACILCDDYLWPVSDGVKRAVDEFIELHSAQIERTVLLDENLAIYFKKE